MKMHLLVKLNKTKKNALCNYNYRLFRFDVGCFKELQEKIYNVCLKGV